MRSEKKKFLSVVSSYRQQVLLTCASEPVTEYVRRSDRHLSVLPRNPMKYGSSDARGFITDNRVISVTKFRSPKGPPAASARQAAAEQGATLQLTIPNRRLITRLLTTTGLDYLFDILPSPNAWDSADPTRSSERLDAPRCNEMQCRDGGHPHRAMCSIEG
jgi:hypothetical protein